MVRLGLAPAWRPGGLRRGRPVGLLEIDSLRVNGKADAVTIFELAGFRDWMDPRRLELIDRFGHGLDLYRNRKWRQHLDPDTAGRRHEVPDPVPGKPGPGPAGPAPGRAHRKKR